MPSTWKVIPLVLLAPLVALATRSCRAPGATVPAAGTSNVICVLLHPVVGTAIRNGWVQLALLSPHSDEVLLYRDGVFERHEPTATHLAEAAGSADWYRGWRDHLEFATIG